MSKIFHLQPAGPVWWPGQCGIPPGHPHRRQLRHKIRNAAKKTFHCMRIFKPFKRLFWGRSYPRSIMPRPAPQVSGIHVLAAPSLSTNIKRRISHMSFWMTENINCRPIPQIFCVHIIIHQEFIIVQFCAEEKQSNIRKSGQMLINAYLKTLVAPRTSNKQNQTADLLNAMGSMVYTK